LDIDFHPKRVYHITKQKEIFHLTQIIDLLFINVKGERKKMIHLDEKTQNSTKLFIDMLNKELGNLPKDDSDKILIVIRDTFHLGREK
jgi:hypothetical protein